MNRVDEMFQRARREGRTAFIPFLTAGDPDPQTTVALVKHIAACAAERSVPLLVELGFPYSDPIADGATIQTSYTRALAGGVRIEGIFGAVKELRRSVEIPLVAMVSYSLVFRGGTKAFLQRAKNAGLDGAIIPDLPVEESDEVHRMGRELDFRVIQLVAPTTPPERARRILAASSGFVYCVSLTGITGERASLPADLAGRIDWLRAQTQLPIAVGFGISEPDHVRQLAGKADAVIVGSAIVRHLGELVPGRPGANLDSLIAFVAGLLDPLRAPK